jgi:hypothetical protein
MSVPRAISFSILAVAALGGCDPNYVDPIDLKVNSIHPFRATRAVVRRRSSYSRRALSAR